MDLTEIPHINNAPFIYFPRFSSPSYSSSLMSVLFWSSQEPRELDHDLASLSTAGSDEIFQQLNDENDYPGPKVFIQENDGKIQYKRILKRSENLVLWLRMEFTEETVIVEAEKYRVLYELSHRLYYDTKIKENAWTDISPSVTFVSSILNGNKDSAFPQKPTFTRIVKRRENLAPGQYFHRTPSKPDESFVGQNQKRMARLSPRGNRPNPRSARDIEAGGFCVFCLSNGETEYFYRSHTLKDDLNRVTCPVLQKYVCSRCGATGEFAHTLKYCPRNGAPLPKFKPVRLNAAGKRVISYN